MRKVFLYLHVVLLFWSGVAHATESDDISFQNKVYNGIHRLGAETVDLVQAPIQHPFITLGVVGAVGLTYVFDRDIQVKLLSAHGTTLNKATDAGTLAGDPFIHLGLAALVYGGGIAANSLKWKETGEMMGEALLLADASSFVIKEASGRGRPITTNAKGDFKPFGFKNNYDSFPSMHTSSSFALASVLSATTDNIPAKLLYYSAATFVGFSRMYQNKHWASDVVLGAAIGELCGDVVIRYHVSSTKYSIVPTMFNEGAGLALVTKW